MLCFVGNSAFGQNLTELRKLTQNCLLYSGSFSAYVQNVSTPPTLGGVISRTAFADVCDTLVKIQNLINHEQNLAAKLKTLSTTSRNWQTDLLFGVAIAQIAASKIYGESQPTDIAEIENKKEDQELRDYYAQTALDGSEDLSSLEAAREKSGQIDAFGRAARKRAMLSESLACPNAAGNKNYAEIYSAEIQPLLHGRQTYKLKKNYYFKRLRELGPSFVGERGNEYENDLMELSTHGVVIDYKEQEIKSDYKTRSAPIGDKEGELVVSDQASQVIQTFTANHYSEKFQSFHEKWAKTWKSYIDSGASYGETYMNITEQCLADMPPKTDVTSVGDINTYGSWGKNCNTASNQKPEKPTVLTFNEVLQRYEDSLNQYSVFQAQIWTKESTLLKKRIITNIGKNGAVDKENRPSCDTAPMSDIELKMNQTKMTAVESEYKEIIAKEKVKSGMLRDEEMAQQKRDLEITRALNMSLQSEEDKHNKATIMFMQVGEQK